MANKTQKTISNIAKSFDKNASAISFKDMLFSIISASSIEDVEQYLDEHPDLEWGVSARLIINELKSASSFKALNELVSRLYGRPQTSVEAEVHQAVEFRLHNDDE